MAGFSIASNILPVAVNAIGFAQDLQQQQQQNAAVEAQRRQAEQEAQQRYQDAVQQQQWELERRALEAQYQQQSQAQQQARQQLEYQYAVQQQQYELAQRAYDQQQRQWQQNRLAQDQQNQLAGLIAQQNLAYSQKAADVANQQAQIRENQAQSEADRQAALRRAVARQRAQFGSSGIGSDSGSGEAVLLGLVNDSTAAGDARKRTDTLREQALTQDLENLNQRNLLERTQLAESQRFQLLTYLS